MNYSVDGKVALITGGARGIGLSVARQLHAKGASVVLADVLGAQAEQEAAGLGDRAFGIACDVRDRASLDSVVEATIERFGGIDVVVANAGIAPEQRTILDAHEDEFERVIDVNLLGVWRTVKAALPHVVERRGHVLVVGSIYSFFNGVGAAPYAMSKAGVESFGRALRTELVSKGATAGVAYFGYIDTRMMQDALLEETAREGLKGAPWFVRRPTSPDTAAAAIVESIEKRAPRAFAPRWAAIASFLRSFIQYGLDPLIPRDRHWRKAQELAEAAARQEPGRDRSNSSSSKVGTGSPTTLE